MYNWLERETRFNSRQEPESMLRVTVLCSPKAHPKSPQSFTITFSIKFKSSLKQEVFKKRYTYLHVCYAFTLKLQQHF